jgi:arginyl-tRNA synthetase
MIKYIDKLSKELYMENIKTVLAPRIANAIGGALTEEEITNLMEYPADPQNGDICFPCFRLAKAFRKAPAAIAAELAGKIELPESIEKVSAVSGYVNFYFSPAYYLDLLSASLKDNAVTKIGEGKTVCIDFSSPNIAKKFHLGHIGTTIIGNSLRNIFK